MNQLAEVESLLAALRDAWAAGNSDAYADLFTANATYVAFDGDTFVGPKGIADSHRHLFAKWLAGSKLLQLTLTLTPLSDSVVVAHGTGAVLPRGKSKVSKRRVSTQTYVAVKVDAGWKLAAFQNTRLRPFRQTLMGKLFGWVTATSSAQATPSRPRP